MLCCCCWFCICVVFGVAVVCVVVVCVVLVLPLFVLLVVVVYCVRSCKRISRRACARVCMCAGVRVLHKNSSFLVCLSVCLSVIPPYINVLAA